MYETLTFLHNITRWLVLAGMLAAIVASMRGLILRSRFSTTVNAIRHWSATLAHIQLVLGMLLYVKSPAVKLFWKQPSIGEAHPELRFFALIHPACMLVSIIILTIGSATAKRRETNAGAYRTMLIWYSLALAIMLIAIPWPFSPLASRPYWR